MNLTLIGMPGVGKSTVGLLLAERRGYDFVDLDDIIEEQAGMGLQDIIDCFGDGHLLKMEENAALSLDIKEDTIIAPGGSIVYSQRSMDYLRSKTWMLYMRDTLDNLRARLDNMEQRGIAGLEKGLDALYAERDPLYYRNADYIIDLPSEDIVEKIIEKMTLHL